MKRTWYFNRTTNGFVCLTEKEAETLSYNNDLEFICEAETGDNKLYHTPQWVKDEYSSIVSDRIYDMNDSLLGDGDDY